MSRRPDNVTYSRMWALGLIASLAMCEEAPSAQPAAAQEVPSGAGAAAALPVAAPPVVPSPEAPALEGPRRFDPRIARTPAIVATDDVAALQARLRHATPADRGLLLWRLAADHPAHRTESLSSLATSDHPLAPWAALRLAQDDATDPSDRLTLLARCPDDFPAARRVAALRAKALIALGREEEALPLLRDAVRRAPRRSGAASAAMPLAALLSTEGASAERLEEALGLYRRVASRAPKADVGAEARALSEVVLARLPATRRRALATIPQADRFFEAEAYARANHHREAEAAYDALLETLGRHAPRRCEAMLARGNALLRQRARQRGAAWMRRVARECSGPQRPWARYKAGRALSRLGEAEEARGQFEALLRERPRHRLADDALFYIALGAEGRDDALFVQTLERLAQEYPEGDMRSEALFRLGMHARLRGQHQAAKAYFEQGLTAGETAEDLRGRAAYWRARTMGDLGQSALDAYAHLVRQWPLSYYAQQALVRLGEQDPARQERLLEEMRAQPAEGALTFPWREELDDPRMTRAIALLQVGAHDEAATELEGMGFLGRSADTDAVWLAASLLAEGGALPRVTRLVRGRLASFRRTMPTGRARALWRLAYPQAFAPLIEERAAAVGVPAAFVRAIAREESSFDPGAVSWAHARGLVQVMLPTARRHAEGLGEITARSLLDAETNLTVGTRFMAWLAGRYDGNVALIPSAYNAGHGALERWMRRNGQRDFDEFVELIPYDETRRYTRRVLQTYGVYRWLDEGELPALPRRIQRTRRE